MNVTKFYGKVNDQEFNNVNDYNAAVTAAAANGSFEASSRTWVEHVDDVEDEPKDQVKKVTKFEGRVNDQVFDNVQDYNKAITRAMNEDNLQHASSRTWVETEVTGSTQEFQEPLPQIDQEDQECCCSQLEDIFNSFGDLVEKEGITEDNTNEFISRVKYFIENNECESKCYLDYINNEIKQLNESLDEIAVSLDDEHNKVGYYKSIIDSKEKEINDQINELKNWEKEYESYKYSYEKNQNTYILWRKLVNNLKLFQNTNTTTKYTRPKWMPKNYFNLLQEIFK